MRERIMRASRQRGWRLRAVTLRFHQASIKGRLGWGPGWPPCRAGPFQPPPPPDTATLNWGVRIPWRKNAGPENVASEAGPAQASTFAEFASPPAWGGPRAGQDTW